MISTACTPNASVICAGSVDRRLYVFDYEGRPLIDPISLDDEVWCVAVSRDGSRIAAGTASKNPARGSIYVVSIEGEILHRQRLPSPVWGVDLSPEGDLCVGGCWNGRVYLLQARLRHYEMVETSAVLSDAGTYGVRIAPDLRTIVASGYDTGINVLDLGLRHLATLGKPTGYYNLAFSHGSGELFAGTREGSLLRISAPADEKPRVSEMESLSSRALCAVAVSDAGSLLAVGDFAGGVKCVSFETDTPLWSYQAGGEVWSTAMSSDGRYISVGSGDCFLHFFESRISEAEIVEILGAERATRSGRLASSDLLTSLYLRYRLADYGASRLAYILRERAWSGDARRQIVSKLLRDHLERFPSDAGAHLRLGQVLEDLKEFKSAVHHYQQAARADPSEDDTRGKALRGAGRCFRALGLGLAADVCDRRAESSIPDRRGKLLLYDLARSYEERGDSSLAKPQFEFLLSWDVDYLDAWERFDLLRNERANPLARRKSRLDYTGATVSMLGPDVPRTDEVDPGLLPVLEARLQELHLGRGERRVLQEALEVMRANQQLEQPTRDNLSYSNYMYMQYEHSPLQDAVKKHLEMANLLASFDSDETTTCLDVGTATGRYPRMLSRLGKTALGVDLNYEGLTYAASKAENLSGVFLIQGQAAKLPVRTGSIDLMTCMMGTFAHIERGSWQETLVEFGRVLRPGGVLAISCWDPECTYQSFLSIYSPLERALLHQASPSQAEIREALAAVPSLDATRIVPFCFFGDQFVYDLQADSSSSRDLWGLVELDLAVKGRFPEAKGQMYLAISRKR